jgi:hypothetical protein
MELRHPGLRQWPIAFADNKPGLDRIAAACADQQD